MTTPITLHPLVLFYGYAGLILFVFFAGVTVFGFDGWTAPTRWNR